MSRIHKCIIIAAVCMSLTMILIFAAVTAITNHMEKNESILSLLVSIGCTGDELIGELVEYEYWKDPLSYISGFEIAVFEVEMDSWMTPEGWRRDTIAADEFENVTGFAIPRRRFLNLETTLPEVYDAWYFRETGREGPFDEWQYHIGLYSEDGVLLIYRGHNLHTDSFRHFSDEAEFRWVD